MKSNYIVQKTIIITGILLSNISDGFIFGQMSGMLDDLRKENATIPLSDRDSNISWIASTINITCFCGFAINAAVTEFYGRRKAVIIGMIPAIASWIMTYLATDMTTLLISRVLAGISYGCTLFISYVNIGEYMSPNVRPISFNLLVCVGSLIGTMLGHTLSLLMSWRTAALVGLIPSILSIILPCFWVESPMWLAAQGRFQESEITFRILRPSAAAQKELQLLLTLEMEKRKKIQSYKNMRSSLKKIIIAAKQLYFWKVNILSIVINIYKVAGGRILFNTLAITMLQDITGRSNILFFTLLTNGFAIFGAAASCVLLKRYKIRALLFPTALIANVLLVGLGALIYFRPDKSEFENWLKVSMLSLYLVTLGIGPYSTLEAVLTEITPLEVKSFCILFQGVIIGIIQFLAIKLAPGMFLSIGYHGVFFLNAAIIFLCLGYMWIFLPETKDRSLQEIELFFKTNSFTTDLLEQDQNKELMDKL